MKGYRIRFIKEYFESGNYNITVYLLSEPLSRGKCQACQLCRKISFYIKELNLYVGISCSARLMLLGKIYNALYHCKNTDQNERYFKILFALLESIPLLQAIIAKKYKY